MRRHHRTALRCYSWLELLSLATAVSIPTTCQPAAATTPQLTAVGGFEHTMVLKTDGSVWGWGGNWYGQLGNGNDSTWLQASPTQAAPLNDVTALAAGFYHTVALKNDGTVWTWGGNDNGQLGIGSTMNPAGTTILPVNTPSQVVSLSGVVTAIAVGAHHTVALKSDGTVWTWGANSQGQLGDGSTTDRSTPVQATALPLIRAVAAGSYHTLAVDNDGTVWSWGYNAYGQLGDGSSAAQNTPVQISGLTGVSALTAGLGHTAAIKSDGTVWAWGLHTNGQLCDNSTDNRNTPTQVIGISGVATLAAGSAGGVHTMALKSDGTVWTWGANTFGQLGDGTTTNRTTPAQVTGLSGIALIAAGGDYSLAVKNDGTLWGWGYNGIRQLGDGTDTNRSAPVQSSNLAQTSSSDRIFNYLQAAFPQFVYPANNDSDTVSVSASTYYYRAYSATGSYLATSEDGVYYLGPAVTDSNGNQSIFRLGSISDWLATAGIAGY